MESKTIRGFKVITTSGASNEFQPAPPTVGMQQALFPFEASHMVILVSFPEVSDNEFVSVLDNLQPRVIVELRKAPRFDFGKMNRQIAFDYFRRSGSTYFDLAAGDPAEMTDERLLTKLRKLLLARLEDKSPFMFLVSQTEDVSTVTETILGWLKTLDARWSLYQLPQHQEATIKNSTR